MSDFLKKLFEDIGPAAPAPPGGHSGPGTGSVTDLGPLPQMGLNAFSAHDDYFKDKDDDADKKKKKKRRQTNEALPPGGLALPDPTDDPADPSLGDAGDEFDDRPGDSVGELPPATGVPEAGQDMLGLMDVGQDDWTKPENDGDLKDDGDDGPKISMARIRKFKVWKRRTNRHASAESLVPDEAARAPRMLEAAFRHCQPVSRPGRAMTPFTISYDVHVTGFSLVEAARETPRALYGVDRDALRHILRVLEAAEDRHGKRGAQGMVLSPFSGFCTTVWVPEDRASKVQWKEFGPTTVVGRLTGLQGNYTLTVNVAVGEGKKDFAFNGDRPRMLSILSELGATPRTGGTPEALLDEAEGGEVEAVVNFDRLITLGKTLATQISYR